MPIDKAIESLAAFKQRLSKNFRHYRKWARRQGLDAWRTYDRDIPQYPFAIDLYGDYCHVQEYDTGWVIPAAAYEAWLDAVKLGVAEATGVAMNHIVTKKRQRQKRFQQYEKLASAGDECLVQEFGHRFIVNLHTYLDTGLFLDHRNTRRRIQSEAYGARFLNLFCYTSSFTVYAAAGGACFSESVDLSNTYLQWSKRNFALNQVDETRHQLVRADVFHYLDTARSAGKQFDLIVLDPPSFSNSKKMLGILDIQRDHGYLIDSTMALLAPTGVLYFSTNLRGFALDDELAARYRVQDITAQTIPDDFRNKKIHRCYRITTHTD